MSKVHVTLIIDKSGSMQTVRDATISAINEYVTTLKQDAKSNYSLGLTLFDTEVTQKETVDLKDFSGLTLENYMPGGNTALYDAVCSTVSKSKDSKGKQLVIIMTDGEENSSREYSQEQFKSLVTELTAKKNWTFVFLGANQDAWANAQKWGFGKNNVVNFSASQEGMGAAMRGTAKATMAYASMAVSSTMDFYSAEDKKNINV